MRIQLRLHPGVVRATVEVFGSEGGVMVARIITCLIRMFRFGRGRSNAKKKNKHRVIDSKGNYEAQSQKKRNISW